MDFNSSAPYTTAIISNDGWGAQLNPSEPYTPAIISNDGWRAQLNPSEPYALVNVTL